MIHKPCLSLNGILRNAPTTTPWKKWSKVVGSHQHHPIIISDWLCIARQIPKIHSYSSKTDLQNSWEVDKKIPINFGKSGPVEPPLHPITIKAQHRARTCARAIRALLHLLLDVFRRVVREDRARFMTIIHGAWIRLGFFLPVNIFKPEIGCELSQVLSLMIRTGACHSCHSYYSHDIVLSDVLWKRFIHQRSAFTFDKAIKF